jgi:hypothetical protein
MGDTFDPKFGALVPIGPFIDANVTASQTNEDMTISIGATGTITMPFAGSVVGLTLEASAAVTAGSIIGRVHKSSTEFAQTGYPAPTLNTTNSLGSYATCRPGLIRFAAGDKLGVSLTSDATWAPTNTNDVTAMLYVVYDPSP